MENLVETIKNDRHFAQMLSMTGINNNPIDFVVNEKVIIWHPIDKWDTNNKRGMVGNIDNIIRRHKGQSTEHYEICVKMFKIHGGSSGRFEVHNILKYNDVEKFVEDWKKRRQVET